jgi:hypothetical protein
MSRLRRCLLLTASLCAGFGCRPGEIDLGEPRLLSTEQRPTRWDEPDARRLPAPAPAERSLPRAFTAPTPAGFVALPPEPRRMRDLLWRVGAAEVGAAECYLTASVGGTVEQNVERWCGQFGIAALPLAKLDRVPFAGRDGFLLELAGSYEGRAGLRMLVAFAAWDGSLATLKLVGDEATVRAHRAAFVELAAALREVPAGEKAPDGVATDPHGGHVAPAPLRCTATVPSDWQPKPGSKRLLHHTFGEHGEVYVSSLPHPLRGLVDVWRGELGLPAIDGPGFDALPAFELLGAPGVLLELGGSDVGRQLRIAAVQQGRETLFVKMSGPPAEVAAQQAAFLAFCRTLRRER